MEPALPQSDAELKSSQLLPKLATIEADIAAKKQQLVRKEISRKVFIEALKQYQEEFDRKQGVLFEATTLTGTPAAAKANQLIADIRLQQDIQRLELIKGTLQAFTKHVDKIEVEVPTLAGEKLARRIKWLEDNQLFIGTGGGLAVTLQALIDSNAARLKAGVEAGLTAELQQLVEGKEALLKKEQVLLPILKAKQELEDLQEEWADLQVQEKAGTKVDWPAFIAKVKGFQDKVHGWPPDAPGKAALEVQITFFLGEAKKKLPPQPVTQQSDAELKSSQLLPKLEVIEADIAAKNQQLLSGGISKEIFIGVLKQYQAEFDRKQGVLFEASQLAGVPAKTKAEGILKDIGLLLSFYKDLDEKIPALLAKLSPVAARIVEIQGITTFPNVQELDQAIQDLEAFQKRLQKGGDLFAETQALVDSNDERVGKGGIFLGDVLAPIVQRNQWLLTAIAERLPILRAIKAAADKLVVEGAVTTETQITADLTVVEKKLKALREKIQKGEITDFAAAIKDLEALDPKVPSKERVVQLKDALKKETKDRIETLRGEIGYWKQILGFYKELAFLQASFNDGQIKDPEALLKKLGTLQEQAQRVIKSEDTVFVKQLSKFQFVVDINKWLWNRVITQYLDPAKTELQKEMKPGDTLRIQVTIDAECAVKKPRVVQAINNSALQALAMETVGKYPSFLCDSNNGKQTVVLTIVFPAVEVSATEEKRITDTLTTLQAIQDEITAWKAEFDSATSSEGLNLDAKLNKLRAYEKDLSGTKFYRVTGRTAARIDGVTTMVKNEIHRVESIKEAFEFLVQVPGLGEASSLDVTRPYAEVSTECKKLVDTLQGKFKKISDLASDKSVPEGLRLKLASAKGRVQGKLKRAEEKLIEITRKEIQTISQKILQLRENLKDALAVQVAGVPLDKAAATMQNQQRTRLEQAKTDLEKLTERAAQVLALPQTVEDAKHLVDQRLALDKEIGVAITNIDTNLAASGSHDREIGNLQGKLQTQYDLVFAEYKKMEREFFEIFSSKDGEEKKIPRYMELQKRAQAFKEGQLMKDLGALKAQVEKAAGSQRSSELITLFVNIVTLESNIDTEILDKITEEISAGEESRKRAEARLKELKYEKKALPLQSGRKVFPTNYGLFFTLNSEVLNKIPYLIWDLDPAFQKEVDALGKKKKPLTVVFNITFSSPEAAPEITFDPKKSTLQNKRLVAEYRAYFDFVNANYPEEAAEMQRYRLRLAGGQATTVSMVIELGSGVKDTLLALKLADIDYGQVAMGREENPSSSVKGVLKKGYKEVRIAQRQKIAKQLVADSEREHPLAPKERKELLGTLIYYDEVKVKTEARAKADDVPVPELLKGGQKQLLTQLEALVKQEPVAESLITGTLHCNYLGRPIFPAKEGRPMIFVEKEDGSYLPVYLLDDMALPGDPITELPDPSTTSVIVVKKYLFEMDEKYESLDILSPLLRELGKTSNEYYVKYADQTIPIDLPLPPTTIKLDIPGSK
ncbi:MAG: hypothetical protein NT099_05925 [Candidatus Saganbacteria bacterium]|nr:hypothetical protein [Candidatus Saganbacteria bacterium]